MGGFSSHDRTASGDEIGDTPYATEGGGEDRCPRMTPDMEKTSS